MEISTTTASVSRLDWLSSQLSSLCILTQPQESTALSGSSSSPSSPPAWLLVGSCMISLSVSIEDVDAVLASVAYHVDSALCRRLTISHNSRRATRASDTNIIYISAHRLRLLRPAVPSLPSVVPHKMRSTSTTRSTAAPRRSGRIEQRSSTAR